MMDQNILSPTETNAEFRHSPRASILRQPKDNSMPMTAKTDEARRVSSPFKGSSRVRDFLFGTFRTPPKGKPTKCLRDDEGDIPRRPARRKSLLNMFGSIRPRKNGETSKALAYSVENESKQYTKSHIEGVCPSRHSTSPKRRKSLSDILGTISSRVSSRRNPKQVPGWKQVHPGVNSNTRDDCRIIAESEPDIYDRRQDNPTTLGCSYSVDNHKDKSNHIEAPKIPIPTHLTEGSYKDSFGAQHSIERIIEEYQACHNGRARLETVSTTRCSNTNSSVELGTRRDSKFDDAILDERGVVVDLDDAATGEITLTERGLLNSHVQLPLTSQGTGPEVSNAQSCQGTVTLSSQLHQSQQSTVCEVESTCDFIDLDPEFYERSGLIKEKYDRLELACEGLANSDDERIATSIKMTLARMPENYYKDFFSENTSPEVMDQTWSRQTASYKSGEKRKEPTMLEGETLLASVKLSKSNLSSNPSSVVTLCRILEDSIMLRSPAVENDSNAQFDHIRRLGGRILYISNPWTNRQTYTLYEQGLDVTLDPVLKDSAFLTDLAVDNSDDKHFEDIVRIGRRILYISEPAKNRRSHPSASSLGTTFDYVSEDSIAPGALACHTSAADEACFSRLSSDVAYPFASTSSRTTVGTELSESQLVDIQHTADANGDTNFQDNAATDTCVESNEQNRPDSSNPYTGPVKIQYPGTTEFSRHTILYKSKHAALTALYGESRSEFDRFCIYNPEDQIISVDHLDNLVPDFAAFDRMGVELIWIPALNQHNDAKHSPSAPMGSVQISERQGLQQLLSDVPIQPIMKSKQLSVGSENASLSFANDICLMTPPEESSDPGISDSISEHSEGGRPCERGYPFGLSQISSTISEILLDLSSEPVLLKKIPTWGELAREYREKHKSTLSEDNILHDRSGSMNNMQMDVDALEVTGTQWQCNSAVCDGSCSDTENLERRAGIRQALTEADNHRLQQEIVKFVESQGQFLDRGVSFVRHASKQLATGLPPHGNGKSDLTTKRANENTEITQNHDKEAPSSDQGRNSAKTLRFSSFKGGNFNKSDRRIISLPSGFNFTAFANHLGDCSSSEGTYTSQGNVNMDHFNGAEKENQEPSERACDIELCSTTPQDIISTQICGSTEFEQIPKESTSHGLKIVQDLNLRPIGKRARTISTERRKSRKVGALIDVFQSHGLMQQSLRPLQPRHLTGSAASFLRKSRSRPAVSTSRIITLSGTEHNSSGLAGVAKLTSVPTKTEAKSKQNGIQISSTYSDLSSTDEDLAFGEELIRMERDTID